MNTGYVKVPHVVGFRGLFCRNINNHLCTGFFTVGEKVLYFNLKIGLAQVIDDFQAFEYNANPTRGFSRKLTFAFFCQLAANAIVLNKALQQPGIIQTKFDFDNSFSVLQPRLWFSLE